MVNLFRVTSESVRKIVNISLLVSITLLIVTVIEVKIRLLYNGHIYYFEAFIMTMSILTLGFMLGQKLFNGK